MTNTADEVWTVDSKGIVRTPLSWLTPRARHAFERLVGQAGLASILAKQKAKPTPTNPNSRSGE